ncbi:hypothetical protein N431DRAFT_548797 [Stipitochalara longipes BDJ]|nr:hypothetical protein N431DRAFT_548797 [Stipitochalara longipes BDJ]
MDQQAQTLPNDSVGPKALAALTPILAIGILFYSIRIYTRVVPKYKLNAADWACTIAIVSGTITYALFATAVSFGFGKHSIYVSQVSDRKIFQCLFGVILAGLWASIFSRVSVALLLLDFAPSRTWNVILWFLVVFQIITLLGTELIELFQCRPVRAFWEQVPGEKCNAPSVMWTLGYVYTGIGMLGDLTFAIMPMFLIWRLSRSVIERCLISFLMAMGLFATGAGVMKIIYAYTYNRNSQDALREMMPEFLWCRIEEAVLIVACSAPLLKAPEHEKPGAGNVVPGHPGSLVEGNDLEKAKFGSSAASSTVRGSEGLWQGRMSTGHPSCSTLGD